MRVFNSLGSNYDLNYVLKSLFWPGGSREREKLIKTLERKYQGKVSLFYKGREALEAALMAADLEKGNFVAVTGFTCFVVYKAVKNANLEVEYLDIEEGALNFNSAALEKVVYGNRKIKAVIIQNTLGYPSGASAISTFCRKHGLILIEDLAHSVGTVYSKDKAAGSFGDFVVLSFSQDKIIDGVSGGALIVRNKNFYKWKNLKLKRVPLSEQTKDRLYPLFTFLVRKTYVLGLGRPLHHLFKRLDVLQTPVGRLSKGLHELPNWQAAMVQHYLSKVKKDVAHRRKIATVYARKLNPLVLSNKLLKDIARSTNIRFPIFVDERAKLIDYLKRWGIHVSDTWYDSPVAPAKYLPLTNYKGQCPNAEDVSRRIVNLPTHRNLTKEDAEEIVDRINQWLKLRQNQ